MAKPVYKWKLEENFEFYAPFDFGIERQYHDEKGRVWLTVNGKHCTIHKGYSWDGCSPKWRVLGKIVGVWDGSNIKHNFLDALDYDQKLKYASLYHDVFCQFIDMFPETVSQKKIDDYFYVCCKAVKFKLSWVYYQAVRAYQKNK